MRKLKWMVLMLLGLVIFSQATQAASELRYVGIDQIQVSLSINGSGSASCSALVLSSSSNYVPSLTAVLKKTQNGSSWTSVASWSASGTYISGASISETVSVSSGYSFQF